jgi:hypothetical protein
MTTLRCITALTEYTYAAIAKEQSLNYGLFFRHLSIFELSPRLLPYLRFSTDWGAIIKSILRLWPHVANLRQAEVGEHFKIERAQP